MKRIGVTGGIGSGKSFVCSILREKFGIPVYDCDTEAKRLIATSHRIQASLRELIGQQVMDSTGHLDRNRLADYLFSSDEHVAKVNAIVHPEVRKDFRDWCGQQGEKCVCMESAILYESGFDSEVDFVLYVDAPEQTRLARALRRDRSTEGKIRKRMRHQKVDEARQKADKIIWNDVDETEESITKQLKQIVLC